jgi:putative Mg2+ transporter-C (MgtC) family protein
METPLPWLGDLHLVLDPPWVGFICIVASVLCGAFVGVERERRDKPAGLRTLILISVGSTIFTLASIMISTDNEHADPGRISAQIVTGVGFLGAGAIIHARGTVLGLTTGATIWAVAAVGVTIGSGFVAAGVCFTMVIFLTLTLLHRVEKFVGGPCQFRKVRVGYRSEAGKTRPQIQHVLDTYTIPDQRCRDLPAAEGGASERVIEIIYCSYHRHHRDVLKELADIGGVVKIEVE